MKKEKKEHSSDATSLLENIKGLKASNRGSGRGRAAELAAAAEGIESRDGGRVEAMTTNVQAGNRERSASPLRHLPSG